MSHREVACSVVQHRYQNRTTMYVHIIVYKEVMARLVMAKLTISKAVASPTTSVIENETIISRITILEIEFHKVNMNRLWYATVTPSK